MHSIHYVSILYKFILMLLYMVIPIFYSSLVSGVTEVNLEADIIFGVRLISLQTFTICTTKFWSGKLSTPKKLSEHQEKSIFS